MRPSGAFLLLVLFPLGAAAQEAACIPPATDVLRGAGGAGPPPGSPPPEGHEGILAHAAETGFDQASLSLLSAKLAATPADRDFDPVDAKRFIDFIANMDAGDRRSAIGGMGQLVDGRVTNPIVEEFFKTNAKLMLEEHKIYYKIHRDLYAAQRGIPNQWGRLWHTSFLKKVRKIIGLPSSSGLVHLNLEKNAEDATIRSAAKEQTDKRMESLRRAQYYCNERSRWRNTQRIHAAKKSFTNNMAWSKTLPSIFSMGYFNIHRALAEWMGQLVIEAASKFTSTTMSTKILVSGGNEVSNRTRMARKYLFGRAWGVGAAVALHHLLFGRLEEQEKEELLEELLRDPDGGERLRDMVVAMDDDSAVERLREGALAVMEGAAARVGLAEAPPAILGARDFEWADFERGDLRDEAVRATVAKAVGERVYDEKRDARTWDVSSYFASGNRGMDIWMFNALYGLFMAYPDNFFDRTLYGFICKGMMGDRVHAQSRFHRWTTGKKAVMDPVYYGLRQHMFGL